MAEFRLRLRYRKVGRLRFLSHLEVIRALERGIRRAGLPYAVTAGYSPRMKAAFGPALPVGTASDAEYLDLWLTRYTEAGEVQRLIAGALPAELAPLEACYVANRAHALTAGEMLADYEVDIETRGVTPELIAEAVRSHLHTGSLTVEHKGKTKVFDLARALPKEPSVQVVDDGAVCIRLTVRIGPDGSLRPDVFATAVLESAHLPARVKSVRRTGLTFLDAEGEPERPV